MGKKGRPKGLKKCVFCKKWVKPGELHTCEKKDIVIDEEIEKIEDQEIKPVEA